MVGIIAFYWICMMVGFITGAAAYGFVAEMFRE